MEHESTTSRTLVGAAEASLPSKFVVFSPNGEMEKGASASALDITSRDETGWHQRPGYRVREDCIHSKPRTIHPDGGNADL